MAYNDSYCKDCIYCHKLSDYLCCAYFLTTNKRRPCPAGKGCTVKETGKKKGAWQYQNHADWAKKMKEARKAKAVKRTAVCPECGTEFEATDPRTIYCSKRCRNRVSQRKSHRRKLDEKAKLERMGL